MTLMVKIEEKEGMGPDASKCALGDKIRRLLLVLHFHNDNFLRGEEGLMWGF